MIKNDTYKPPHYLDKQIIPDIVKITDDIKKCITINKNKLNLNRMSLHNKICNCNIPEIVMEYYDSNNFYLFRSKKKKKVWYIIKKSIMCEVIQHCINIFPCLPLF